LRAGIACEDSRACLKSAIYNLPSAIGCYRGQLKIRRGENAGCRTARLRSLSIYFTAWIEVPAREAAHCHWAQFPEDTPS